MGQGGAVSVYNLISFAGLFVLAGVAWLFSSDRKVVNWRVIGWGIGLQLLVAHFKHRVPDTARIAPVRHRIGEPPANTKLALRLPQ